MVKKRTGGAKRYKAAAGELVASSQGQPEGGSADGPSAGPVSAPPKRLQTKIARKVAFLDKVSGSHKASLALGSKIGKKQRRKKQTRPLPDLSSLLGALEEVGQQQQKQGAAVGAAGNTAKAKPMALGIKTNKGRAAVTIAETARLQQVLAHPLYKANPILAITNHLGATLPALPDKPSQRKAGGAGGKHKSSGKGARRRRDDMQQ